MRSLIVTAIAVASLASVAGAQARQQSSPEPQLKDHNADWMKGTRPRDPFADQKGRVWFVGQTGNYIGRINSDGTIQKFEIDAGTNPHNIVIAPNGTPWYTGNRNGRLVKMDPETGKITTYMISDTSVRDPHTMIFDQKGNAWFTAQRSAAVGHFDTKTEKFTIFKFPRGTNPYGIVVDNNGRPWFDLFGTNKIGTIDPVKMEVKEYVLPAERSRPRRVEVTSDGAVWYGDYSRGFLGRLDPKTGQTEEWALPGGAGSLPYGMAVDDQDRIWVAETGPTMPVKLVAFNTKKKVFEHNIPLGDATPNSVRHMQFDPATKTIWFGQDKGFISSLKLPAVIVP